MKKLLLLFLVALTWQAMAESIADFVIALPDNAIAAEKTAAQELQTFLLRITGKKLPIQDEKHAASPAIHIGRSPEIERLLGDVDFSRLRPDEIILRKIPAGFVLSGDRPRGTLYAVYTLLEDFCGVRFWSPAETSVPKNADLTLPDISLRYAPPFFSREFFSTASRHDPVFSARKRFNGHFPAIPEAYGEHLTIVDFCHSFRLLDTSKHPEWNSLYKGKRTANGVETGQLCLSNRALRQAWLERTEKRLAEVPNAKIITVSQNDISTPCECADCTRMKQENAWNETDLLLDFVNECAIGLKRNHPDLKIETLAYNYTKQPPFKVRPADNVIVRLCTHPEKSRTYPLAANPIFSTELAGWKARADQLYIWNYVSNFSQWLLPFPNLTGLGANLKFFADHNVKAVFEQGNSQSRIGEFAELRDDLESRLLWNPSLDTETLIQNFCREYYGPAAPAVLRYIDVMHREAARPGAEKISQQNTDGWLRMETLLEMLKLMDDAMQSVRTPPFDQRLARASLPIRYALLCSAWTSSAAARQKYGISKQMLEQCWQTVTRITEAAGGETHYRENQPYSHLRRWLDRRYAASVAAPAADLPPEVKAVDSYAILDLNPEDLKRYYPNLGVATVPDPLAGSGQAVRMNAQQTGWAVQVDFKYSFLQSWFQNARNTAVYARLRIVPRSGVVATGPVVLMGAHPGGAWSARRWNADQIGETYRWMKLGSAKWLANQIFYIAPLPNKTVQTIYLDRILLVSDIP